MSCEEGQATELEINGKKVILRDKLPAKDSWAILEFMRKGSEDEEPSFEEEAHLLSVTVLSWEFEGDPSNSESYADLDLFREFLPLRNAVSTYLNRKFVPLDGLGLATYRALTQRAPMPWEATKWMLILKTGWTLAYVDSLGLEEIVEGFAVLTGIEAAKNA